MYEQTIKTKRLIDKPFSALTKEEKEIIVECWRNPFCARFNAINNPSDTIEELIQRKEPTFSIKNISEKSLEAFKDTNYFRVVFDINTGELIGVCRFGMYYEKQRRDVWDFALFNVLMKHWGKGYGVEMLSGVCEFAKSKGIKYLYASADNDNFGSYHAMIKSGFKYAGLEADDFAFRRDLTKPMPTKEEINEEWQKHVRRYIRKFGKRRFDRLNKINELTKEMIYRIKTGESENLLIPQYYSICNSIEEFPEKCEGR